MKKLQKTKALYNHKNTFEKKWSTQVKHVVPLTQKNDYGCHDIILAPGGYFEHTCFSYVCK